MTKNSKSSIHLNKIAPDDCPLCTEGKEMGVQQFLKLNLRLRSLQEQLYAEHRHKVLVVLQAMDTGGKDGAIRHVFEGVNPQGVRVASFKKPSEEEQNHDYLWRIHQQAPKKGEMVIFNRSHYEDVLVVRVHDLCPKEIWKKRYQHINDFERMLTDEGTTIIKFFLHISKQEQMERLLARLDEKEKHWKFSAADIEERKLWDKYQKAFGEMLDKTNTDLAPWHIIPADKKWYRNLVVAKILVERLESLKIQTPKSDLNVKALKSQLKTLK